MGLFVPSGSTLYEEKQISIIGTDQIVKAHKQLTELGSNPQALQADGDGYRYFEVKDLDGNSLQISEEALTLLAFYSASLAPSREFRQVLLGINFPCGARPKDGQR